MDKAEKRRLQKLEKKIQPGQGESRQDLSALSVEELEELEGYIIKHDNGQEWTEREERRISAIMAKVK